MNLNTPYVVEQSFKQVWEIIKAELDLPTEDGKRVAQAIMWLYETDNFIGPLDQAKRMEYVDILRVALYSRPSTRLGSHVPERWYVWNVLALLLDAPTDEAHQFYLDHQLHAVYDELQQFSPTPGTFVWCFPTAWAAELAAHVRMLAQQAPEVQ